MSHPTSIAVRKLFVPHRHWQHEFWDLALVLGLIVLVAAFVQTVR